MLTAARSALAPLLLAAALGCRPLDGPDLSLVGTWAVLGFVDHGVAADVEGSALFTAYGAYTFDISRVEFPGEPPDAFVVSGTYQMSGDRVTLSGSSGGVVTYGLLADGDRVIMTSVGRESVTRITLRATSR